MLGSVEFGSSVENASYTSSGRPMPIIGSTEPSPRVDPVGDGHRRWLLVDLGAGVAQLVDERPQHVLHLASDRDSVSSSKVTPMRRPLSDRTSARRAARASSRRPPRRAARRARRVRGGGRRPIVRAVRLVDVGLDEGAGWSGNVAATRHHAPRRFQSVDPAEVGRARGSSRRCRCRARAS